MPLTATKMHPQLYAILPMHKQRDYRKGIRDGYQEVVIHAVCKYFDIELRDIVGPSRRADFARPRHIAMYIIKYRTNWTWVRIGGYFGDRDHSTVIYANRLVSDFMSIDKSYKMDVDNILAQL